MALKPCTECGYSVSTKAAACPQCGAKGKKPTSFLTKIVAALLGLSVLVAVLAPKPDPSLASAPAVQKKPADPKKEAAFQRTLIVVKSIKASLRDPSSVEWSSIGANEDASVVCVAYRARNGLGGMNLEGATYAKGKLTTTAAAWNKNCAGKSMPNDFSSIRAVM